MTRKLTGQDTTDGSETKKVDARSQTEKGVISVDVRVDGAEVRILNDKGVLLDDCTAYGQDFSKGRIAIRTDSDFLVRSDNQ